MEVLKGGESMGEFTPLIAVGSTLFGIVVTYLTFIRGRDKTIRSEARETQRITESLNYISLSVNELKQKQEGGLETFYKMQRDITRIEASLTSAHKRIDHLVKENK